MDCRELALGVWLGPSGRAIAGAIGGGYILESDCAFEVLACEYRGFLPLYKYSDIRHGMARGRGWWLQDDWQLMDGLGFAT